MFAALTGFHHLPAEPAIPGRGVHGQVVNPASMTFVADHGSRQKAAIGAPTAASTAEALPETALRKSASGSFHGRVNPLSCHSLITAP